MLDFYHSVKGNSEALDRQYLTNTKEGVLLPFDMDSECLKELHKEIIQYPDLLKKLHTLKEPLWGNLLIHYPPKNSIESLSDIHNVLSYSNPDLLRKIHLTKNNDGRLPAHCFAVDVEKLQELHRVFENDEELLFKIHTTKDINGRLPIHCVISVDALKEIHRVFKNAPEKLAKLHLTKDSSGLRPIDYCSFDEIDEIKRVLSPETYDKISYNRLNLFIQSFFDFFSMQNNI